MDSRIREALEYIQCLDINPKTTSLSATKRVRMAATKAAEALSLLAAEPEPCEDACELAVKVEEISTSYRRREIRTKEEMIERSARIIDAYASRLAQEARADERAIVEREVAAKLSDPHSVYANALRGTIDVSEVRADDRRLDIAGEVWDLLVDHLPASGRTAIYDKMRETFPIPAILQGTEPAKEPVTDELLWQEIYSLREKIKIAIAAIKADNPDFDDGEFTHRLNSVDYDQLMEELSGTEPAKRSCPECGTAIQENGWGCHHAYDCSMGAHHFTDADFPAKVSEDVERDAGVIAHALGHSEAVYRNLSGIIEGAAGLHELFCEAQESASRLVSRIKECHL
jgi:hypothetical protein